MDDWVFSGLGASIDQNDVVLLSAGLAQGFFYLVIRDGLVLKKQTAAGTDRAEELSLILRAK